MILRQLALLGFAADVAGNGREALERWRSGDYALLLSDLHMPEMDGYELAMAIRAAEQGGGRIPIMALTANALRGEAERCRAVGMDDYLSKPARLMDLKTVLEKWLSTVAEAKPNSADACAVATTPVDVRVLEGLVGNDPAVITEFLHDFRIGAAKTAVELKTACDNGHAAQAGASAHKLKSSARSVGALALGELCAEMEQAGKAGQVATLAALLPRFEAEMAAVDRYLAPLNAAGWSITTSPKYRSPPPRWWGWKPWCAGAITWTEWCFPISSSAGNFGPAAPEALRTGTFCAVRDAM